MTADLTKLPSRHSETEFGDGVPVSASTMRKQIRMANNLANYKTAPHMPMLEDGFAPSTIATVNLLAYRVVWIFPFYIGAGRYPGGRTRKLNVAPCFRSATGNSIGCRITSSANPPNGYEFETPVFHGPSQTLTFSTSSTTIQYPASQELTVVRAENIPEMTWITLEGQVGSQIYGLPELWLGPLQNKNA